MVVTAISFVGTVEFLFIHGAAPARLDQPANMACKQFPAPPDRMRDLLNYDLGVVTH
jgi:hypothetical protein